MSYENKTALASLIVAAALLAGCGKAKDEAAGETEAPTPVMVETAVLGAIDHVVTADAVLFPINQSSVTPKISAPVKRVLVNRGDHVRAGQLIAELESSDLAAAVEEAKYQYEQAQSAYATVTGATVVEDETKARADVQSAQSAFDAAKKLYDSRVALQKEGALAQKQVDETRLQMVQAQTPIGDGAAAPEVAERGRPARGDPGCPGADERGQSASGYSRGAAFLRAGSQPHQRRCCGPVRLSRRNGQRRHAPDFHRRHIPASCGCECTGERSRVHSSGPAGSRGGARRRHPGHGDRGQSVGQRQCHHRRSVGADRESGRAVETGRHGTRIDHRGNHPEHAGGPGDRASQR